MGPYGPTTPKRGNPFPTLGFLFASMWYPVGALLPLYGAIPLNFFIYVYIY